MKDSEVRDLLSRGERRNSTSYAPAPIVFERGEGPYLFDVQGNAYLDFIAGIAVCGLGHCHPRLSQAISEQAAKLLHVSNLYYSEPQIEAMDALARHSFGDRVFFCNSGAEANEAAIKLARRYQATVRGEPQRVDVVTMEQSFHGRTYGALTATGQPKYHRGFGPMVPGFKYTPFNDLDRLESVIDEHTAAILLEPIQGEGGIYPATEAFLQGVRQLCTEQGLLLIFDEVQAGVGRTGELFAYQGYGVVPDLLTLAKGLGGGVPVGAMVAKDEIFEGWTRGSHATTFGGNPLASRAVLTVLSIVTEDGFLEHVRQVGLRLSEGLKELQSQFSEIVEVRGRGLMIGAECGDTAGEVVQLARERGLLINTAGGQTLRLVPPLIVEDEHVDIALERLEGAFQALRSSY